MESGEVRRDEWGEEDEGSREGGKSGMLYKDSLFNAEAKEIPLDAKGRGVFEDAWNEHISSPKEYFDDAGSVSKQRAAGEATEKEG